MPDIIMYLLRVNIALVLFYLVYFLVLRRLTFYTLNRAFLLFGIGFSVVYPFVDLSTLMARHQELNHQIIYFQADWMIGQLTEKPTTFDYWQVLLVIFWLGVSLMLGRFLMQLASLYRIHLLSRPARHLHFLFRQVTENINPFSFMRNIYLNPDKHAPQELGQILQHEHIHVQDGHTLDVLVSELCTAFFWFNPGAWLLNLAVKQNLEFIADHKVLSTGLDSKMYQYSLVRISSLNRNGSALANNFNILNLKTRIAMMNKKPSTRAQQIKFLVVLPTIAILLLAFSGEARTKEMLQQNLGSVKELAQAVLPEDQTIKPNQPLPQAEDPEMPAMYQDFLNRNKNVSKVHWNGSQIIIQLKSGIKETYDIKDEKSLITAVNKYGTLPLPPPPPPVVVPNDKADESSVNDFKLNILAFIKSNKQVSKASWDKKALTLTLQLKSGAVETYDFDNAQNVEQFLNKYGMVPPPPPPAPEIAPAAPAPTIPSSNIIIIKNDDNASMPDANPDSPIKGASTIKIKGSAGEPLYMVNGEKVDQNAVSKINPDDISSIEVLKDKTAKERYGAEASQGAVLITTKEINGKKAIPAVILEKTVTPEVKLTEINPTTETLDKEQRLLVELKSDGLYSNDKFYTFKLTNSAMYINGQKQSDVLFRKYRKYLPSPNKNIPGQTFEIKGRFREK